VLGLLHQHCQDKPELLAVVNGYGMYNPKTLRFMVRWAMFSILVTLCVGCSTHNSTLQQEGSTAQILYAIPEEHAFQIAHGTLLSTMPGRKIEIIDGPARGYSTYTRFGLDTYTQQVLVFPAEGLDALGKKIRGYYFEVSGSGSSGSGYSKNIELFEKVREAAKATGKGIAVTGVERTSYTSAEWHNGQGVPVKSKSPGVSDDTFERLERLKGLRDRGVITEEEFEAKKKELLERL
jgi:hypothetical protein